MTDASIPIPGGGQVFFDERSREETVFIVDEVFGGDGYLQHGIEIADDDVVFDVGANIGLFSIFAVRRGAGRVLAFEPVPAIHRLLLKNLEANAIEGVEAFERGLTKIGGPSTATFTYFAGLPANSTMFADDKIEELMRFRKAHLTKLSADHPVLSRFLAPAANRRFDELAECEEVTCGLDTIESVVRSSGIERIDLLKIDVEGAEEDVLAGVGGAWPKVRQIALETHGEIRAVRIANDLEAKGFEVVTATPKFAAELGLDNRALWARRSV